MTRPKLTVVSRHSMDDVDHMMDCQQCQREGARRWSTYDHALTPGFKRGATLFVEMLEEMDHDHGGAGWDCSMRSWERPGRPQRNIVAEYLARLPDDPEERRGFTALLSWYVCESAIGGSPLTEYVRLFATMPGGAAEEEWRRRSS